MHAKILRNTEKSRDTARRDIVKLTEAGMVDRTHGGIILPQLTGRIEQYKDRICIQEEAKRRIAKRVRECLKDKDMCFLDTSTTLRLLCESYKEDLKGKTIFTHSMDNVLILSEEKDIDLHAIGGKVNGKNRFFYGGDALRQIQQVHFEAVVLGAAACMEDGLYYEDQEDAQIKRVVSEKADLVIVAADVTKFSKRSRYKGIGWGEVDLFITETNPGKKWEQRFSEIGVSLIYAGK